MGFKCFQIHYYFSSDCMKILIVGLRHHFIYKYVSKYNSFTNPNVSGSQDNISYTAVIKTPKFQRRSALQRMRRLDDITDSMDMSLSKLREIVKRGRPGVLLCMGSQSLRHELATEQQQTRVHFFIMKFLCRPWPFYGAADLPVVAQHCSLHNSTDFHGSLSKQRERRR